MRVLIDLHGGDPNDVVANAEYQEIKDRVMFEVRDLFFGINTQAHGLCSAKAEKVARMP